MTRRTCIPTSTLTKPRWRIEVVTRGRGAPGRECRGCVFLLAGLWLALAAWSAASAQGAVAMNPLDGASVRQPHEYGVLAQGGTGLTDGRDGIKFLLAGFHAGRVLTNNYLPGPLRGNFEYAVEVFPYWQSWTPKFERVSCAGTAGAVRCSNPYTVGGTYHGVSVTPIMLRWNFAARGRVTPWVQGAGGVLWTNHKYPAYGDTTANLTTNGPNGDASVWNFTPQAGVGTHFFFRPDRSVDLSANAIHVSSASLGDRNPGVNASVQFSVGYTWWK